MLSSNGNVHIKYLQHTLCGLAVLPLSLHSCRGALVPPPGLLEHPNKYPATIKSDYILLSDSARIFYEATIHPSSDLLVLCIHGFGNHSGSFRYFLEVAETSEFSAVAIALRGFGLWRGEKGDSSDMGRYLTDIEKIIQVFRTRYAMKNIYLLGQSFGSHIVL